MEKNYILESGTADDVNKVIESHINNGTAVMIYTDRFMCDVQKKIEDTKHLLEVRVFNENAELKIMRSTIDRMFSWRYIDDTKLTKDDYIEEYQYLDIDTNKSSGCEYTATGGGKYHLPVSDAEKVVIRNYISYDDQGIAQITDFRIVRFTGKENA